MRSRVFSRLFKRKIMVFGFVLLFGIGVMAILAPLISPFDPRGINPAIRLESPNPSHWLGTDNFGRDILSRVFYGARLSLVSGLSVVGLSVFLGLGQ